MVLALGIDQLPTQKVRVTAELVRVQQQSGQQGKSTAAEATLTRAEEGVTVEQAIQFFEQQVPQHLFLPDNTLVVFGASYARQGVNRALDYLERERSFRRKEWLILTDGSAQDLLKADPTLGSVNALAVRKLVEQATAQSTTVNSEQLHFMRQFLAPSQTPLMARVDVDAKGRPLPNGVGICPQGKWVDSLNPEESQMVNLLLGKAEQMTITLPAAASSETQSTGDPNNATPSNDAPSTNTRISADMGTTVQVLFSKTRMTPHLSPQGPVSFTVQVYNQAELSRLPPGSQLSPDSVKKLEGQLEAVVTNRLTKLLAHLQSQGEDAAQLGTLLYRTHPHQWQHLASRWPQVYRHSSFQVRVKFHLLRTGLIA
ncbi:hypothetical protein D2Q93_15920, partial [Alicyclobacillaceae bacterium I2511]